MPVFYLELCDTKLVPELVLKAGRPPLVVNKLAVGRMECSGYLQQRTCAADR